MQTKEKQKSAKLGTERGRDGQQGRKTAHYI